MPDLRRLVQAAGGGQDGLVSLARTEELSPQHQCALVCVHVEPCDVGGYPGLLIVGDSREEKGSLQRRSSPSALT